MKKLLFLFASLTLTLAPLNAQPKNETLDKLVNIGVTNGEVSVSDVEMLFPEWVSKTYTIENAGTKRAPQTVQVKTVNHEKLLMLIVNAVKSHNALRISDEASLLSSVKRGEIDFREVTASVTKTEFEKGVSPKSAPRMKTTSESATRVQTDLAKLEARFPELVKPVYAMESRTKQSPVMTESKVLDVAKATTTLLESLKAEVKKQSVAEL
ncbi:MAG: hypothetical protein SNJ55_05345 [Chloroherpetonaceae bacterium]